MRRFILFASKYATIATTGYILYQHNYVKSYNLPRFVSAMPVFSTQIAEAADFDPAAQQKARPFIGCSIRSLEDREGMMILLVNSESPAALAKLKPGDIILKINGKDVNNINDYNTAVGEEKGVQLTITIERNDKQVDIVVQTI